MKAKIELIPEENVEETIIRCHKMTDEIQNIVSYIENEKKIIRYKRGTAYPLNINSIYYFEIVDQNAFVYCEKEIYESKMNFMNLNKKQKVHHSFVLLSHLLMQIRLILSNLSYQADLKLY